MIHHLAGMGAGTHKAGASELELAFQSMGMNPSDAEFEAVLAIGCHEGSYGRGWKQGSPMQDSHNWGAIQCCPANADGSCPPGSALQGDSHADGTKYTTCFRVYPDQVAGAAGLIKFLYRADLPQALRSGDLVKVADRMFHSLRYFEEFCKQGDPPDPNGKAACAAEPRIRRYAEKLDRCAQDAADALGVQRSTRLGGSSMEGPLVMAATAVAAVAAGYAAMTYGVPWLQRNVL